MKKDPMYLPKFAPEDFESFRSIMKNEIAPTFQEWLERRREQIAHYSSDWAIVEVKVNAHEFAAFCHSKSTAANAGALIDFATNLAKANP
ncbi:MAG TPA: hypothetical protein VMU67_16820 [Steroidobacteraceae bacterium]|nr:hypothetical protein [Steroidobacteraceae bacterium]